MSRPLPPPAPLPPELIDFLHSGPTAYLATRDESLAPEIAVLSGIRMDAGSGEVRVLVPSQFADTTVQNARANGELAATFTRTAYRPVPPRPRSPDPVISPESGVRSPPVMGSATGVM